MVLLLVSMLPAAPVPVRAELTELLSVASPLPLAEAVTTVAACQAQQAQRMLLQPTARASLAMATTNPAAAAGVAALAALRALAAAGRVASGW